MNLLLKAFAFASAVGATVTLEDPSNIIDVSLDASDNAILADYSGMPPQEQEIPIVASTTFSDTTATVKHKSYTASKNDTSALLIDTDAVVTLSYIDVYKTGYSSSLYEASFYGVNAAVNIANGSVAHISHLNVTTHNGAANVYSYGKGTYAYVTDAWLYSSGPVAHGLYAGGYGTVVGREISHYSGGNRCSSFAGDSPEGYVYVYDSIGHTTGIGSATFYALGNITAENVIGLSENAPSLFMDGVQYANLTNVDLTAGLLAGILIFCSAYRESGGSVDITDSVLTTTGDTMAAFWFGNTIATVNLIGTDINTASGILVIANMSQVTQAFDYFAGTADNSDLQPAEATVTVKESALTGDIVAYEGSTLSWSLSEYTTWTGKAYVASGTGSFGVYLDSTSNWTLTGDTTLLNFTSGDTTLGNINSNGYNIYYSASAPANSWLGGATIALSGGGYCEPTNTTTASNTTVSSGTSTSTGSSGTGSSGPLTSSGAASGATSGATSSTEASGAASGTASGTASGASSGATSSTGNVVTVTITSVVTAASCSYNRPPSMRASVK